MEKFEKNGVMFTVFEKDGETYLCTGEPTGEIEFDYAGDVADYYEVVGATSVVSGKKSIDELYAEWLEVTKFYRECGIKY
jgi:hypothetical protein